MPKEPNLTSLEKIFLKLEKKLNEMDKNAVRNQKYDFSMVNYNELLKELNAQKNLYQKKRVLLTRIGHLRINLFYEFYERIQLAQNNNELDKAINLMNEYTEQVAMPFLEQQLHPSLFERLIAKFSTDKAAEISKTLNEWNTLRSKWLQQTTNTQQNRLEQYNALKKTFIGLYHISFSVKNYPPVATDTYH